MNRKFRVIIDFDFQSKKKFTYDLKFVNIRKPGFEINALDLIEYLKQVVSSLEKNHLEDGSVKDTSLFH